MRTISIHFPPKLLFGNGCRDQVVADFCEKGFSRVFLISTEFVREQINPLINAFLQAGVEVLVDESITTEPGIFDLDRCVQAATSFDADSIIAVGGGSVMDVAKLVAVMAKGEHCIHDLFGINRVPDRLLYLACLPTTAGTGSEVSPNAIIFDESEKLKKGVVSPVLVPDAAYVDPLLTLSVPSAVTASTGLDALTHCIEAYANKFSHPIIDSFAIQGIELISKNLLKGFRNGSDETVRENLALASLYGGYCLGPVNTGAVHALAYPLGSMFQIAHGISNALLLPFVMEFNMPGNWDRYADIAIALGATCGKNSQETATRGLQILADLYQAMDIPTKLSRLNIQQPSILPMAKAALTIERLLKNNLRTVTLEDAVMIYEQAL